MKEKKKTYKINGSKYTIEKNEIEDKIVHEQKIVPNKNITVPDFFYKYYSFDRAIELLEKSKIFLSHPNDFNDPMDCADFLIDFDKICKEDFAKILELKEGDTFLKIPFQELSDYFSNPEKKKFLIKKSKFYFRQKFYAFIGIFCVCDSYKNYRLWSYYTNHKGVSFKFNTNELKKMELMNGPFPIHYQKNMKSIDLNEYDDVLCKLYQTNVKNKFWAEEKEWRFVYQSVRPFKSPIHYKKMHEEKAESRLIDIDINVINTVYLGHNFFTDFEIIDNNMFDFSHNQTIREDYIIERKKKFKFFEKIYEMGIQIIWIRFLFSNDSQSTTNSISYREKEIKILKIEDNKIHYE